MERYFIEEWRNDPYRDWDWDNDGFPGEFVYGDDMYVDDYYGDEVWKPINGFEDFYWVSDYGRVWSVKRQMFLKLKHLDKYGHLGVALRKNGMTYYRYIHRLVAEAFVPNPNNYPIVRHIDGDPEYNSRSDIAWGTQLDNMHDCIRHGRAYTLTDEDREKGFEKTRIPIIAVNEKTGEISHFRSQTDASRILNIQQSNIWKVLNGERPRAGGYYFEYANRGDSDGDY